MSDDRPCNARRFPLRFLLLLVLLGGYFAYLSLRYDLATGGVGSALTWSFFVLCTPVADAGALLDFPLRMLMGVRMVLSEMAVWAIALTLNLTTLALAPGYYQTTLPTRMLYLVLTQPWPYWGVIALSGAGTFMSVMFGDQLLDALRERGWTILRSRPSWTELMLIALFAAVVGGYFWLMAELGLQAVL